MKRKSIERSLILSVVIVFLTITYSFADDSEEMAKLLIERGANINHVTGAGKTALQYATEQNHINIVNMLTAAQ